MSKKILFFMLSVVIGWNVSAQNITSAVIQVDGSSFKGSRVRVWNNDNVISCYGYGSLNKFALGPISSNTAYSVDLPTGLYVSDFKIYDDKVFFCGNMNGAGILGYFEIADFYNMQVTIQYQLIPQAKYLSRLVAYSGPIPNSVGIMAVGYWDYNTSNHQVSSVIVYCNNYDTPYNFHYYISYCIDKLPIWLDEMLDIDVTDNYVVITEPSDSTLPTPRIRQLDKFMIPYSQTNTLYRCTVTPSEPWSITRVKHLNGDTVATATMRVIDPSIPIYSTVIRTYDIATMSMITAQERLIIEKAAPDELLYMPVDKSLLLTQAESYPTINSINSVITAFNPFATTSYTATCYYLPQCEFPSLARYKDSYFIANGTTGAENSILMRNKAVTPLLPLCDSISYEKVTILPTTTLSQHANPLITGTNGAINWTLYTTIVNVVPLNASCIY